MRQQLVDLMRDGGVPRIAEIVRMRVRSHVLARALALSDDIRVGREFRLIGRRFAQIGQGFSTGDRTRIECVARDGIQHRHPQLVIGDRVRLNDDVHIGCAERIEIADDVLIGSKVLIIDHGHGSYSGSGSDPASAPRDRGLSSSSIRIGARTWIGELAVVLPGTEIGEGSVVGAAAVVRGDVPKGSIIVGNPGRIVKVYESGEWRATT